MRQKKGILTRADQIARAFRSPKPSELARNVLTSTSPICLRFSRAFVASYIKRAKWHGSSDIGTGPARSSPADAQMPDVEVFLGPKGLQLSSRRD
jgi:hypothetical protein